MNNKLEGQFSQLKNQEVSSHNKQELMDPAQKKISKARYEDLARDIKSSDTRSTVMHFFYSRVIDEDGKIIREGENIALTLMIKDKEGNIGVIGLAPDLKVRYMEDEGGNHGNQLVHSDDPENPIKIVEPHFAAIIKPDGTIEGKLPQKLLDFLSYEKRLNEDGDEEYINSNFVKKDGGIASSYFYTHDKRLTDTKEIEKISQRLKNDTRNLYKP